MQSQLTLSQALKAGWDKAFSRFGLILGSIVVAAILIGIPSSMRNIASSIVQGSNNTTTILFVSLISLGLLVLQYWLQILTGIGLIRIQLNTIDNKPAEFGQLFNSENVFWTYFGASILYGLIVLGGILLLIVPGIYWAIKYQFTLNLVVDKKLSPVEALRESGKITQGHKWWLFGFGIVLGLINLATIFTLFLGLVITIPVTVMAQMYVYRNFSTQTYSVVASKSAKKTTA
ncbi:MAG: hypothetical protein U0516_01635 [Candidatus Saccharibacteria bacterium]